MQNWMVRRLAMLTVLAVMLPLATAGKCQNPEGKSGTTRQPGGERMSDAHSYLDRACDMGQRRVPHVITNAAGLKVIEAAVAAQCDQPPVSHHVTVWLEREVQGVWQQPKDGNPRQEYNAIPPAPPAVQEYPVVYTGCRDGNWRVRARATGEGPAGKQGKGLPFDFTLPESELIVAVIRCAK